jgi:hypothetical protein
LSQGRSFRPVDGPEPNQKRERQQASLKNRLQRERAETRTITAPIRYATEIGVNELSFERRNNKDNATAGGTDDRQQRLQKRRKRAYAGAELGR